MPTFKNRSLPRNTLYFEMGGNRAIRKGKWKAVARQGLPSRLRYNVDIPLENWELYDMDHDRTETKNLAGEFPEILKPLVEEWQKWITTYE